MTSPTKLNSGTPNSRPVTTNNVINAENRDVEREQLNRILSSFADRINSVESSSGGSGGSSTVAVTNNDGTITVVSNGNTFVIGIADNGVNTTQLANDSVTTAKLATVNSNVGSFGTATQTGTFTVNAKGQVTAASNTAISIPASAISDSTTVGRNFLTLPNPGAITFTRINADNTVSTLDAAAFRTAIGAGTVSSVAATGSTGLTVGGSPITGSGTLTFTLSSTLSGFSSYNTNGLVTQTAANTFTGRTLTGTANEITVTNGNGVSGNPAISIPTAVTFTGKTVTGGTFNSGAFNGTVGATTPSTGAFTTMSTSTSANSTVRATHRNTSAGSSAFSFVTAGNDTDDSAGLLRNSSTNSAYGGANSLALYTLNNHPITVVVNNAVVSTFSSTGASITGTLSTTGNATLGDSTSDSHTVNGSLTGTTNIQAATYFAVDTVVTTDANSGTETISVDLANGAVQKCTRNGNHTLNVTGPSSKHLLSCTFYVFINTTGGITSFGSNVYLMSPVAQSISTNRTRVFNGFWDGTNFYIVGLVEVTGDVRPS